VSVPAAEVTTTTVRYLFASSWAQGESSNWGMHVPGAKVAGLDTAANLLSIAVWSLREQGLVEVQQLRPVTEERVVTMGGKSATRMAALEGPATALPGLEGALLAQARERPERGMLGRLDDAIGQHLSGDDERGLRGLVLALNLNSGTPWTSVTNHCREEARAAGLIEVKGRLFKKPVIADPAAVQALEKRDAEIVAARDAFKEKEAELDGAIYADCAAAVSWAHTS
jgi:hypothetical protein